MFTPRVDKEKKENAESSTAYVYVSGPEIDKERSELAAIPDDKKTEAQKARQKELDIYQANYKRYIEHEGEVEDRCIRQGKKYYRP